MKQTTTATVLADNTANVPTTLVSYLQRLKALDETSASVSDKVHSEVETFVLRALETTKTNQTTGKDDDNNNNNKKRKLNDVDEQDDDDSDEESRKKKKELLEERIDLIVLLIVLSSLRVRFVFWIRVRVVPRFVLEHSQVFVQLCDVFVD